MASLSGAGQFAPRAGAAAATADADNDDDCADAMDKEAVRLAVAMAGTVAAAVRADDKEGLAARRAAQEFAEKEAELDALLLAADSDSGFDDDDNDDDRKGGKGAAVAQASPAAISHFELLLAGILARELGVADGVGGGGKTVTGAAAAAAAQLPRPERRRLSAALRGNGFEGDAEVPRWLALFFTALWLRTPVAPASGSCGGLPAAGDGDVGELLSDLQKLGAGSPFNDKVGAVRGPGLGPGPPSPAGPPTGPPAGPPAGLGGSSASGFDCYDHGAWVRVRLSVAGVLGLVHVQEGWWCVEALDMVPDDGLSTLSAAKALVRPA